MKQIASFNELPEILKDFLADPTLESFIENFLKYHNVTTPGLNRIVLDTVRDCVYGRISIEEMLSKIEVVCSFNEIEIEEFFNEFLDILDEEGLVEIEKYDSNNERPPVEQLLETTKGNSLGNNELERNPQAVQAKLLQVLAPFNLHVDEEGIVAHEVERYLRGEVLAKDLVPHLSALLDKPLSEINALVESLNESIFKPIQKQIAEEGTLDISYDDDASLKNLLVIPKRKGSAPSAEDIRKKIQGISFIPKEVLKNVSRQERDAVAFDLRAQGGTPSGTSLLSQEILEEQLEKSIATPSKKEIASIPKYTIDPYRENI